MCEDGWDYQDWECPQCGYQTPDPDFVYLTAEEIKQERIESRHNRAMFLWDKRSSDPSMYMDIRSKWWSRRHYRRIAERTAKYAEQEMLRSASPSIVLDKFCQGKALPATWP